MGVASISLGPRGGQIETRSLPLPGTLIVVTIVVGGVGPGRPLATTGPIEHASDTLGTIPGGGGEMVAAAESLHAESLMVAVMNVVGVFVVPSLLPLGVGATIDRSPMEQWRGARDRQR